jgi:hypothetical protein
MRKGGTCGIFASVVGNELAAAVSERRQVALECRHPARVDLVHQNRVLVPVLAEIKLRVVEDRVMEPILRAVSRRSGVTKGGKCTLERSGISPLKRSPGI